MSFATGSHRGSGGATEMFTDDEIRVLIKLVQAFPVLYAADKRNYKQVIPRETAWTIIAEKLQKPVLECEKRWRYLRDRFVKERRKLTDECREMDKDPCDVKSAWTHYEQITFLHDHVRLTPNSRKAKHVSDTTSLDGVSPSSMGVNSPHSTSQHGIMSPNLHQTVKIEEELPPPLTGRPSPHAPVPPPYYNPLLNPLSLMQTPAANPIAWSIWSNTLKNLPSTSLASPQMTNNAANHSAFTSNYRNGNNGHPASTGSTSNQSHTVKRRRLSGDSDININVTVKQDENQASSRFSEYHFCLAMAEMFEEIKPESRPHIKVKVMELLAEAVSESDMMNGHAGQDSMTQ